MAAGCALLFTGPAIAAGSAPHVVDAVGIQARMERHAADEDARRLEIQTFLARPDVQRVAEGAGLDPTRAAAAVAVLSGEELAALSSQAAEFNSAVGGSGNVVISATALIIILLLIIIVT